MSPVLVIAALLFLAGTAVGGWGAARLWRGVRVAVTLKRPDDTARVRLLGRAAVGGVICLAGAAIFLAGLHLRGALVHADALPLEAPALAAGVVLLMLALGAIVGGWWYQRGERRRRSFLLVFMGLALLGVAYGVTVMPRVQRQGLRAGVPTLALILAWPWLPEGAVYELDGGPSSRRLAAWQRAVLKWRSGGVIAGSSDRTLVARAVRLYSKDASDRPTASPELVREAFGAYCSADRGESDAAAEFLFVSVGADFLPPRFDDATAAHLAPLVERGVAADDPAVAQRALWTVERLGDRAVPLVPVLERIARRRTSEGDAPIEARASVSAIAAVARSNDGAWKLLADLCGEGPEAVRVAAVQEMKSTAFAGRAAEILALLTPMVESGPDDLAAAATSTLIFLDPAAGEGSRAACRLAPMILARAARTEEVGMRAVRHLATGCESEEVHELIARLLRSESERAAWHALSACAALGPRAERHRVFIEALATHRSARIVRAVGEALTALDVE